MAALASLTRKPVAFGGLAYGTHLAALTVVNGSTNPPLAVYSHSASDMADYAHRMAHVGTTFLFNTDSDGERIGKPYAFVDADGYHSWFSEDQQASPCLCYVEKRAIGGTCPAHPDGLRPVSVNRS